MSSRAKSRIAPVIAARCVRFELVASKRPAFSAMQKLVYRICAPHGVKQPIGTIDLLRSGLTLGTQGMADRVRRTGLDRSKATLLHNGDAPTSRTHMAHHPEMRFTSPVCSVSVDSLICCSL